MSKHLQDCEMMRGGWLCTCGSFGIQPSAPAGGSGAFIATTDAARERMMHRSTFRRRAMKLGVRYRMGSRIWDGYEWDAADLQKLMPLNTEFSGGTSAATTSS